MNNSPNTHEIYEVTVSPGHNPENASLKLAHYIINRWLPGNAGGVHFMLDRKMANSLLQFFQRSKNTTLIINTMDNVPVITEKI